MKEILYYFLFRVLFSIIPQALPFADETWQAPEIAHKDVFGYGWLTWEWTREQPLRSPIYHSIFSFIFYILKQLNLDYGYIIAYAPRITQCGFSAIYDYYLIKLLQLEGIRSKSLIILVNYTIWFSLNCFSKTIINTFEAVLFTIALYNWILYLQKNKEEHNIICRIIVIIISVARHSAIIPWVYIWPMHLLTAQVNLKGKIKILIMNIITLMILAISSLLTDIIYHKKLTSSFYNFLEFNLLSGNSSFYGIHHPTWFISEAIPFISLGWVVFLAIGIYYYLYQKIHTSQSTRLFNYMLFVIAILSLSAHKEDRFLLPLFPIFIYFICYGIQQFDKNNWRRIKLILIIIAIISNIVFFILMNTYQDVGALKTIGFLRERNITNVEYFTSCHSTPFYSFLHKNVPMNFPDCSPTKDVTTLEVYKLHENPSLYIQTKLLLNNPSHIVIYNYFLNDDILLLLKDYTKVETIYHQLFADSYFDTKYNIEFVIFEKKSDISN